jgi:hypothetical protein
MRNPEAVQLLEKNLDAHVNWNAISANPAAIHIIEKNQDKINWDWLSQNPAIFVLDRDAMRQQIDNGFAEEIIATVLHPRHFARNLELYGYDIGLNEYVGFD